MQISDFETEKKLLEEGFEVIIGTDEVGRGPLAGPVVAAAVSLKYQNCHPERLPAGEAGSEGSFDLARFFADTQNDTMWNLIRDSKKLSEKQREKVFDFIQEHFYVGIGLCDHSTIDRINILEASFLAMKKAVQELSHNMERIAHNAEHEKHSVKNAPRSTLHVSQKIILVDGSKIIPNFSFEQRAIVGGDRLVKSISAASIVAKVTRDRMMKEFAQKYPEYGFEKHMGYGTKFHMDAIIKHGPCEIHRTSFGPVKKALEKN